MVQYATPKTRPDYSTKEGQQGVTRACGTIFTKLPGITDHLPSGGGWQVNSHNISLLDETIMTSILLQRPRKA